jgi:hypothetical protein
MCFVLKIPLDSNFQIQVKIYIYLTVNDSECLKVASLKTPIIIIQYRSYLVNGFQTVFVKVCRS